MSWPKIRKKSVEPGQFVWANELEVYRLPPQLRHNQPLLIVAREERWFIVRDAAGKTFRLQGINIEAFQEFQEPDSGKWISEFHPRVTAWLERVVERRKKTPSAHDVPLLRDCDRRVTETLQAQISRINAGVPEALLAAQRQFFAEKHRQRGGSRFARDLERDYGDGRLTN